MNTLPGLTHSFTYSRQEPIDARQGFAGWSYTSAASPSTFGSFNQTDSRFSYVFVFLPGNGQGLFQVFYNGVEIGLLGGIPFANAVNTEYQLMFQHINGVGINCFIDGDLKCFFADPIIRPATAHNGVAGRTAGSALSSEYRLYDFKLAESPFDALTVNSNMVVPAIELPGGDIQTQIDNAAVGTTTGLDLSLDKIATGPLNMSGFGISNVGILNSTTCNASSANVSGAMTCNTLQASSGILGSALSATGGDITVNGGIIKPFVTEVTDLGSSGLKFRDAYLSRNVNVGGTITTPGPLTLLQLGYRAGIYKRRLIL